MVDPALQGLLTATQWTDDEMRHVLTTAMKDANRILRDLPPGTRRSQIALSKMMVDIWGGVGDSSKIGIGDAFDQSAEYQALFDERLFRAAGIGPRYWEQSMLATARSGIDAFIARKENGITLSQRVYKGRAYSSGLVDDAVNNGLLLGKSQREIAKSVIGLINPNVPGGVSYAAMRLGRTEVQNAYHTNSVRQFQDSPWVEKVLWELSGSHPETDECNEFASGIHFRGGKAGEYRPDDVPPKPHPQCLCYITPVSMDEDAFVRAFHQGKFDNYVENQMGCGVVA